MAPPESAALEAVDLACRRGGRLLFERLSFRLEPGDLLELRGPNGTGKSSLLRLLAGFSSAASGYVRYLGSSDYHERLHYLGAGEALKRDLSLAGNLAFWSRLAGGANGSDPAIAAVRLADLAERPARMLSAGQRRRAGLARLLLDPRPLWLLDEPETGLDRASRAGLEQLLDEHRASGGIIVLATHSELRTGKALLIEFESGG